jgi:predicted transcriptional regulator
VNRIFDQHRQEPCKRTIISQAVISREQVISHTIGGLLDRLFGGSAESLVMSLLETKHLTPQKLAQLQEAISAAAKERGES